MSKPKYVIFLLIILCFSLILVIGKNKVAAKLGSLRAFPQKTISQFFSDKASHFEIQIDVNQKSGAYKQFYNGIGLDSFNDGILLKHNRAFFHLLRNEQAESLPDYYVITKGIFMDPPEEGPWEDGGFVYQTDAAGNPKFNWQIADQVFDELLGSNFKPIVSFTFMPKALAADRSRRNPWNKSYVSPPADYQKWRELIYQTVLHLKDRYGVEEIRKWYFEVWNEPDLFQFFWVKHPEMPDRGNNLEYFKLYDYTVDGALAAEPSIKIGGPAMAGDIELFTKDFLKHCFQGKNHVTGETGSRIDFISRHHYGYIEEEVLTNYKKFIDEAKKQAGEEFSKLEILITETGPSTTPKAWLNSRYVAAWMVKEVDGFFNLGDRLGADILPDIVCFWTKPLPPNFDTHFGLATALGSIWAPNPEAIIKRPAFNAYQALNSISGERLQLNGTKFGDFVHGLATIDENSTISILLYHLNESDFNNSDSAHFAVALKIDNLPFTKFHLGQYRISETLSNGYSHWQKMGSPTKPTPDELVTLQDKASLTLFEPISEISLSSNTFEQKLQLQSNSVILLILSPDMENCLVATKNTGYMN